MKTLLAFSLVGAGLLLSACASNRSGSGSDTATHGAASNVRTVKSRDGSYEGEVAGTPQPGAKFTQLQIGMHMDEVQTAMGHAPDMLHTYESGKRWIPFYFGNDARRMQVLYKGEGCLIFADGNVWGGAGGDLLRIDYDVSGACYEP